MHTTHMPVSVPAALNFLPRSHMPTVFWLSLNHNTHTCMHRDHMPASVFRVVGVYAFLEILLQENLAETEQIT